LVFRRFYGFRGAHSLAFDLSALFSGRNAPLIGLDISSTSVKLVELSSSPRGGRRLERYAIEPLPRGAVVDGNIEKVDVVADTARRAWRKAGCKTKNVALALPASAVITKKILLPANLNEDELEIQVESEANQYIPFALDEVSLDFCVVGPAAQSKEEAEVLLAASRKERVEDRVAVAEAAGLKAVVMDIETYAARAAVDNVSRQFPNNGEGLVLALFYIGANTLSVSVTMNGQVVYERDQAFGGNQLTQDIARAYGLSFEEAETKKRGGDLPDGWQKDFLTPFVETSALEVTRALQFFFTSTPYSRVDQIMLAGGCAVLPGLVDAVVNRTQVPTSVVSPFKGMDISPNVRERQLQLDAPMLMVAGGLAMRRFDA
jgi:type IV pilus assembly protein PilM